MKLRLANFFRVLLLAAGIAVAGLVQAEIVSDPGEDIIASFTPGDAAPHPDVDVLSSEVTLNLITNQFIFTGTHAGAIGTSINSLGLPGAIYVWGLDRGRGSPLLAGIGATNVLFDSVVILGADGSALFVDIFAGGAPTPIAGANVTIAGATITGVVDVSEIPVIDSGAELQDWTWNLWPRFILDPALNLDPAAVSDFAPDNSNARLTIIGAVSEPGAFAVFGLGLALLALRRRG